MKFYGLLPYYDDLKTGVLFACAYAASVLSLIVVSLLCKVLNVKFGFGDSAALALVGSGVLWLMPALHFIPAKYSNWFMLGALALLPFFIKILSERKWRDVLIVWLAFSFSQFALYLYVINRF